MKARVDDLCDTPPSEQQVANARALASLIRPIPTLSGSQRNDDGEIVISGAEFERSAPKNFHPHACIVPYVIQHVESIEQHTALKKVFPTTVEGQFHLDEWIDNSFCDDRMTLISIRHVDQQKPIGFMTFRREISVDMYNHKEPVNQICHSISIDYVYIEPDHRNGITSTALIQTVLNDVKLDAQHLADLSRSAEIKRFEAPLHFRVHSDPISDSGWSFVERVNSAINMVLEDTFTPEEISGFVNSFSDSPAEPAY